MWAAINALADLLQLRGKARDFAIFQPLCERRINARAASVFCARMRNHVRQRFRLARSERIARLESRSDSWFGESNRDRHGTRSHSRQARRTETPSPRPVPAWAGAQPEQRPPRRADREQELQSILSSRPSSIETPRSLGGATRFSQGPRGNPQALSRPASPFPTAPISPLSQSCV